MSISPKLILRQSQKLLMTPHLQQAIRLLQLSSQELIQFVEAEIKSNPLLEMKENNEWKEGGANTENSDSHEDLVPQTKSEKFSPLDFENATPSEDISLADTDSHEVSSEHSYQSAQSDWKSSSPYPVKNSPSSFEAEENNIENFTKPEITLKEHLSNQMMLSLTGQHERLIASHLIDMVDEAGYLHADLEEVEKKLSSPPGMALQVLEVLQTFEPSGVFARSLAECLAIQLKDKNRHDPLIAVFLKHLDLVAKNNIDLLSTTLGVDKVEIIEMIEEIKKLNPKPGLAFGFMQIQPIVPDIFVHSNSESGWIIELNNDALPQVLVNNAYYTKVSKVKHSSQEKEYVQGCLQNANWLVKCLDQRAQTILKVAKEIVRQQDAFLTYGIQHLKPMNLKTIADAISMHESTVSRVTSNKYIATPRGIFELKYFFSSSLAHLDNDKEAHSAKAIQHRIKQLIEAEVTSSVLSDDMIVDKLKNDGVDIARRTVAKYRESMRIPSSVQRKREKKFQESVSHLS